MSRKMSVEVSIRLLVNADDDLAVKDFLDSLSVQCDTDKAYIEDAEVYDHEVVDSK